MEIYKVFSSSLILVSLLLLSNPTSVMCRYQAKPAASELRTYIIHVQPPENEALASTDDQLETWYSSFLPDNTASVTESRMVYTYGEVFSGFAARLTEEEIHAMQKKDGFVRAYPDRRLPLLTTHTPDFLGFHLGRGLWNASALGTGIIVGMLDTGVRPDHPSFDDDGVPPPPKKWKGSCGFDTGCNNKLIGGRSFTTSGGSPVDEDGHGTHTSSTAAGNFVKDVSFFGQANGTAAGIAPHAHLAVYKVCDPFGCDTSGILAGMDTAVKDGVDVLSLSLGGPSQSFDQDPLAIGAFGATEKGIIVVCAGGNSGPTAASLSNEAPWILTVAASTLDRTLTSTVTLGNGQKVNGETLYQPTNATSTKFPLSFLDSGDCDSADSRDKVEGKVVICLSNSSSVINSIISQRIKEAGGAGLILIADDQQGYTILVKPQFLPASNVASQDGTKIVSYVNSSKSPTASITFKGTILGASPAPVVAFFSSRGPNTASPGILKPDITGPGVNILAAWHEQVGSDKNRTTTKTFNMISGTSMSTPHLSGIAALVKSVHPEWSPAAIKSAIMTTSDAVDTDGRPILDELHQNASFFAMGAGHVNASKAADPGLVYDLDVDDYIAYLCKLVGDSGVRAIVRRRNVSCSRVAAISEAELNYPSILVTPGSDTVTVNRTVTNVGEGNSTYIAKVDVPEGASVTVKPATLKFSKLNQKISFTVTVSRSISSSGDIEGNLIWVSDDHIVRSPIIISGASGSL